MTFLIMLSVILLSMLTTLHSKFDQPSYLNRTYKTLLTGAERCVLISMLENLSLFHLIGLITQVIWMWKWMGLFSREHNLLRRWDCLSFLNWIGALMSSLLLKLRRRKVESWFVPWSFFWGCSLSWSIYHMAFWAWAPNFYEYMFDKLQQYVYIYATLFFLHLLPPLNPPLIVEM